MVVDDINTIRDANASTFSKTLAAANFIPISKFVKGGKLFYKLASSSGREVERAIEFSTLLSNKKTGHLRELLMDSAQNPKLKEVINQLWRPEKPKYIGNGGTADFVRKQLKYGLDPGDTDHIKKANERLKNLQNIMASGKLDENDYALANAIYSDLKKALNGK
ncbi:hypothetical protein [Paenibacillus xylanexedens]|uniref:hypothetical protein n=1 Tax=Paenibacillus xylanexedens TaxID=528191 RepID=UPI0011AB2A74|nr:hypothetical protein [Paenibacillus xylanexedens]